VKFYEGGRDDLCWFDVPGGACRILGQEALSVLAKRASMGAKCTRVDIRLDLFGDDLSIVRDAHDACESGQLRHVRRYQWFPIKSSEGESLGEGLGLGSLSSPRYVRIYDKGLETGSLPRGRWVRIEAQLRDHAAHECFCALYCGHGTDDFQADLLARLFGVFDFREGPRDIELSRLPRPAWWARLIGSCDVVRPAAPIVPPDLERWLEAVRIQYGSVMREAARAAGVPLSVAADWILRPSRATAGTLDNPILGMLTAALVDNLRPPVASRLNTEYYPPCKSPESR
jgi:hypothetical protein